MEQRCLDNMLTGKLRIVEKKNIISLENILSLNYIIMWQTF